MTWTAEEWRRYQEYTMQRIMEEIDGGLTLERAEDELKEFEAGIYEALGIEPDGGLIHYLNDFDLIAKLERLELRVSVLAERAMHAEARSLLAGEPKKFSAA